MADDDLLDIVSINQAPYDIKNVGAVFPVERIEPLSRDPQLIAHSEPNPPLTWINPEYPH
jgi:hypothetical protein